MFFRIDFDIIFSVSVSFSLLKNSIDCLILSADNSQICKPQIKTLRYSSFSLYQSQLGQVISVIYCAIFLREVSFLISDSLYFLSRFGIIHSYFVLKYFTL